MFLVICFVNLMFFVFCVYYFLFLRLFEMIVIILIEKDFKIVVKDYDIIGCDDVIGEIMIDLE